jgi:hypothetical protein
LEDRQPVGEAFAPEVELRVDPLAAQVLALPGGEIGKGNR